MEIFGTFQRVVLIGLIYAVGLGLAVVFWAWDRRLDSKGINASDARRRR